MGIDVTQLREELTHTLQRTELDADLPGLGERIEGKVRDSYVKGDRRVIVVTDRVSTFDVIVGTLPLKGQVLNQLAAYWFEQTRHIAPNHLLEVPDPAASVVRECRLLPIEFVVRGYLTGASPTSIWTVYDAGRREYCGHRLPDGLHKHERMATPLVTPTTKAEKGQHDELISRDEAIRGGLVTEEEYDAAARIALELFGWGSRQTEQRGLILVDTKYEIGVDSDGNLTVIDEIHTPDSSRYWHRETYERAMSEGTDPAALDKEYVRRWLIDRGYRGEGVPPELPADVRCEAARRYIEAYEQITGQAFTPVTDDPLPRLRRNLARFSAPDV